MSRSLKGRAEGLRRSLKTALTKKSYKTIWYSGELLREINKVNKHYTLESHNLKRFLTKYQKDFKVFTCYNTYNRTESYIFVKVRK